MGSVPYRKTKLILHQSSTIYILRDQRYGENMMFGHVFNILDHFLTFYDARQGDADGYDLVVVDAMHMANYASRICHSCRPNCEAK